MSHRKGWLFRKTAGEGDVAGFGDVSNESIKDGGTGRSG